MLGSILKPEERKTSTLAKMGKKSFADRYVGMLEISLSVQKFLVSLNLDFFPGILLWYIDRCDTINTLCPSVALSIFRVTLSSLSTVNYNSCWRN